MPFLAQSNAVLTAVLPAAGEAQVLSEVDRWLDVLVTSTDDCEVSFVQGFGSPYPVIQNLPTQFTLSPGSYLLVRSTLANTVSFAVNPSLTGALIDLLCTKPEVY